MTEKTTEKTKMLDALLPKQEVLVDEVAEEYIRNITQASLPNGVAIECWLDCVYALYDRKRPNRIEIVESPQAGLALASELTGTTESWLDNCGVGDSGWVAFYDYFHRIGVLSDEESADVIAFRDFIRVVWDTILLDECAIIIQRPVSLRVDDAGNLHAPDGPCIEWADGEKDFAWHGTWVPEKIVLNPRSYTREEYLAITNTEERRALSESGGWTWVSDLLGTTSLDIWVDPVTQLRYELLGISGGVDKLLVKQSPPLKDRSQPRYIEPVHVDLKTAQAARKWQATTLTPAECERDPELVYGVEA